MKRNYYVYILENEEAKRYIGFTQNLETRLKEHNKRYSPSTQYKGLGISFILKYLRIHHWPNNERNFSRQAVAEKP